MKISKKNIYDFIDSKIGRVIFWTVFPLFTFFVLQFAVQFAMIFAAQHSRDPQAVISSATFNAVYSFIFFALFAAAIYFVPKKIFGLKMSDPELGISKEITWVDFGLGILGLFISMIAGGLLLEFVGRIFPEFQISQSQNLGFKSLVRPLDYMLAFTSLAIIPPLVEEFVFRGVIYGQLRKTNVIFAIFWTSLLFGIFHLQLNVGIFVFVMSLVMCFIREKFTSSIWAGMIIHFLKNAIAFLALYFWQNPS